MAIRIKTRQNESVGQMLRRFKKLCEKEGLTKDIKRRQYFEKPSERRRRAMRKTIQRLSRLGVGPTRGGGRPAPPPPARGGRGGGGGSGGGGSGGGGAGGGGGGGGGRR